MYICQPTYDDISLAKAELEAVHEATKDDEREKCIYTDNDLIYVRSDAKFDYTRLALTKHVSKILCSTREPHNIPTDAIKPKGSFAVRQILITGSQDCEAAIGERIQQSSGQSVNLENPDTLYRVYTFRDQHIVSKHIWQRSYQEFERRKNAYRPFQRPVTMHPIWCRTLVNLAGITINDAVLDPFCGTGGLLIEAGLLQANVYGADVSAEMVKGTEQNLNHFGCKGTIDQRSIQELDAQLHGPFDAIITALPYGRASYTMGNYEQAFLEYAQRHCIGPIIFTSDQPSVGGLEPTFSLYQHSRLTNYIYVTTASTVKQLL